MKYLLVFFIVCITTVVSGQTGTLIGKLTDKENNNEPLPFANITIKGTTTGTTTDFDGLYTLTDLEAGSYIISYSFVGYEPRDITVIIDAGKTTTLNVSMAASSAALDEVVIKTTVRKDTESALLLDQKKAVSIKQSIGAAELSRKGVSNAAAAVSKISGVSKQENSSNVYVRGLGDRYLNTTMNGLALPSNNINNKNIDLDLFSSDIIENVSISKAYNASFYGDFSAGNINVSSKEYSGKGFFDVAIGSGFNTRAIGKNFLRNEGTGYIGNYARYEHNPFAVVLSHGIDPVNGEAPVNLGINLISGKSFTFKNDSKLSVFLTASFDNSFEYRDGIVADYTAGYNKLFSDSEVYDYATTATAMATAVYRYNTTNKLKFTSLFVNSSSDEVGFFGVNGQGILYDFSDEPSGYFQTNYQFNQDVVLVNQLVGDHRIGDFDVDWGIGYNRVFSHEPDRKRISLLGYDNLLDNDPNTSPSFAQNNNFNNQRYFQNIEDEDVSARINLAYNISEQTKLNFGVNGKSRTRNFDNQRYGYKNINTTGFTITDVQNLNSIFNLENFVNGVYETHVFNPLDIQNGIGQTNFPGALENTYKGQLDTYAGYVSGEFKIDNTWLFVPGVRVENFKQRISYNAINLTSTDPGFSEASETFVLPSLNIKYTINDDQNIRFAFSKTVSLPEFKEIAPFVYEGISYRIGGNQDILGQNPGVNVANKSYSDVYNVDLKYDWFLSRGELLSFGVFAKQINNPINLVLAADATGTQRYFRTGDRAQIFGLELEARKDLLMNSEEVPLLSAGFNFTYMDTTQDLYNSIEGTYSTSFNRDSDALEGASPVLINADLRYTAIATDNLKTTANLVFNYAADRIFSLGSGEVGNVVEKAAPALDFVLKNKIGKHSELNFSASNLLNPNIEMIRENTGDGNIILSSFKRGLNIGLQYKYNF